METLAEGVEEPGQLAVLRAEGCRQIQGFLLSRPLVGAQVISFISEISARPQLMLLRA
jgi:EAL domain-containing protein (putative c-di-GMP-specific phosphodiesterase class I)